MNALSYSKGKNQGAETHSRPAPFPFPLFLFPVKKINDFKVFN